METTRDPRKLEALRLTRAGEKQQAYQVLVDILKHDRDNFDAWMFMAQVTDHCQLKSPAQPTSRCRLKSLHQPTTPGSNPGRLVGRGP